MHPSSLRRAVFGAFVTGALGVGIIGVSPASASTLVTFSVSIHRPCVDTVGPATLPVTMKLLTSTDSVLQTVSDQFGLDGSLRVCFDKNIVPGMKLSALTNGATRTWTVPKLSLKINRVSDVVSGVAPAGKQIEIQVAHFKTFTSTTSVSYLKTVSSTGTYSVDTTAKMNIIGGDRVGVTYRPSSGDIVGIDGYAPQIGVRINSSRVTGHLRAGSSATIALKNSAGTVRANAYLASEFSAQELIGKFVKNGYGVTARVGDKVASSFASNASFTIRKVSTNVDASTDVVSGSCIASHALKIEVTRPDPYAFTRLSATCSSAGTYSVDITSKVDIRSGDRVLATSRLSSGDTIERLRIVP